MTSTSKISMLAALAFVATTGTAFADNTAVVLPPPPDESPDIGTLSSAGTGIGPGGNVPGIGSEPGRVQQCVGPVGYCEEFAIACTSQPDYEFEPFLRNENVTYTCTLPPSDDYPNLFEVLGDGYWIAYGDDSDDDDDNDQPDGGPDDSGPTDDGGPSVDDNTVESDEV